MKQDRGSNSLFALAVLLGGASYGCVSPVVKLAYQRGFSAGEVTTGQFYYAVVILWMIVLITIRSGSKCVQLKRMDIVRIVGLGLLGTGTAVFYYGALHLLPAWLTTILLFQFSWMTFVIDYVVRRKKPTKWQWISIGFIVIGTILANLHMQATHSFSLIGMIEGLLSGATYAAFLYINGSLKTPIPPFLRAALITTVSAVAVSFIYVADAATVVSAWRGMWIYGSLIGLLSQAIPTSLFAIGIPRIGGSAAAILSSVELPVAVILAAMILHEQVGLFAWAGVLLIIVGIGFGQRQQRELKASG